MTTHWVYTTQKGGHTLVTAQALAAEVGVDLRDSPKLCDVFTDPFTGVEYRYIALAFWNRTRNTREVWVKADATRDDVTAALVGAARLFGPGGSRSECWTWRTEKGQETAAAELCRRLDEYGNDLSLVVGIPDTVPAGMAAEVGPPTRQEAEV